MKNGEISVYKRARWVSATAKSITHIDKDIVRTIRQRWLLGSPFFAEPEWRPEPVSHYWWCMCVYESSQRSTPRIEGLICPRHIDSYQRICRRQKLINRARIRLERMGVRECHRRKDGDIDDQEMLQLVAPWRWINKGIPEKSIFYLNTRTLMIFDHYAKISYGFRRRGRIL